MTKKGDKLSPQERIVLLCIAKGTKQRRMAEMMHLSPKTVAEYRRRLQIKLGIRSNAEMAVYCDRLGMLRGSCDEHADWDPDCEGCSPMTERGAMMFSPLDGPLPEEVGER